jgi:peptidoglycan/xylan/chitin deacetylase (PgdA/CDA1 family)
VTQLHALMYHDVFADADPASSGFEGADADLYKLSVADFDAHLWALGAALGRPPSLAGEASGDAHGWALTFDDGGCSAATLIAPRLSALGWRGHFFVTAGRVGTQGFVSPGQLRELTDAGHRVGSHSDSHPLRMAALSRDRLLEEWRSSVRRLSDWIGAPVDSASVPGGWYAPVVAEAAAECGIRHLFTSEPTSRPWTVGQTTVYGRYSVQRWTPAATASALAGTGKGARRRQAALWAAKKLAKRVAGQGYVDLRARVTGLLAGRRRGQD